MVDNLTASQSPSAGDTSRGLNIAFWVLQVLLAIAFVFSGLMDLTKSPDVMVVFDAMGTAGWMPYLVGTLSIIGGIGLLIPRVAGAAGLAFVALMLGAVLSHLILGVGNPILPLVLLVLSALVAYGRRAGIAQLRTGLSG